MKFRWTIEELKEFSDERIIIAILSERMSELDMYSPLYRRLNSIKFKIERDVSKD